MQCPCGRAARGFGWQDPIKQGPAYGACSMACLDAIHKVKGDMQLLRTEADAIGKVVQKHLADLRGFDYASASQADITEFAGWLYAECCDAVRAEYDNGAVNDEDVPF